MLRLMSSRLQAAEAALAAAADVESQLTGRAKREGEGGEEAHRQRTAEILEQVLVTLG